MGHETQAEPRPFDYDKRFISRLFGAFGVLSIPLSYLAFEHNNVVVGVEFAAIAVAGIGNAIHDQITNRPKPDNPPGQQG